jgi:uncharacterized membrane protein YgdD (TMEM256/DUF423 family)
LPTNPGETVKIFIFLGAIFCFSGVLAGAVGSHALKDYLIRMEGLNRYLLATDYMFYHGIALILIAFALDRFPDIPFHRAGWLFVAGTFLFQGNLYLLSLTSIRIFSALTPIGGSCLLIAWLLFAVYTLRIRKSEN